MKGQFNIFITISMMRNSFKDNCLSNGWNQLFQLNVWFHGCLSHGFRPSIIKNKGFLPNTPSLVVIIMFLNDSQLAKMKKSIPDMSLP